MRFGLRSTLEGDASGVADLAMMIPGFLSRRECVLLYSLATEAKAGMVEIGSWQGRSTSVLCHAGLRTGIGVFCVDNFSSPNGVRYAPSDQTTLLRNLQLAHCDRMPTVFCELSYAAAAQMEEPFDFLFIDGDHNAEVLRRDMLAWLPKVAPGGVVLFHDYGHERWPAVRALVDRLELLNRGRVVRMAADGLLVAFRRSADGRLEF